MDRTIEANTVCPAGGMLSELRSAACIVGARQLRKAVLGGFAARVYLADDADPALTAPLAELCAQHDVPVIRVPRKKALGEACGIDVGAAAAAVRKTI